MNIGEAVQALKEGKRVLRKGWNGKGMWLRLHEPEGEPFWRINSNTRQEVVCEEVDFVQMKTADNKLVPWLCSQTDLLATDWEVLT